MVSVGRQGLEGQNTGRRLKEGKSAQDFGGWAVQLRDYHSQVQQVATLCPKNLWDPGESGNTASEIEVRQQHMSQAARNGQPKKSCQCRLRQEGGCQSRNSWQCSPPIGFTHFRSALEVVTAAWRHIRSKTTDGILVVFRTAILLCTCGVRPSNQSCMQFSHDLTIRTSSEFMTLAEWYMRSGRWKPPDKPPPLLPGFSGGVGGRVPRSGTSTGRASLSSRQRRLPQRSTTLTQHRTAFKCSKSSD